MKLQSHFEKNKFPADKKDLARFRKLCKVFFITATASRA